MACVQVSTPCPDEATHALAYVSTRESDKHRLRSLYAAKSYEHFRNLLLSLCVKSRFHHRPKWFGWPIRISYKIGHKNPTFQSTEHGINNYWKSMLRLILYDSIMVTTNCAYPKRCWRYCRLLYSPFWGAAKRFISAITNSPPPDKEVKKSYQPSISPDTFKFAPNFHISPFMQ